LGSELVEEQFVFAGKGGLVAVETGVGGVSPVHHIHGAVGAGRERPFEEFGVFLALIGDFIGKTDSGQTPDAHLTPFADDEFLNHEQLALGLRL